MARDPVTSGASALPPGTLEAHRIRSGVQRGPLFQRRVLPRVFGEPEFPDVELVPEAVCPARPHVIAYDAWQRLVAAAAADGQDADALRVYAGYRSVAFQAQIWEFRLDERRKDRAARGLEPLSEADLRRQQRVWTAVPGTSAHHTGFALDLGLYRLGRVGSRRHPAYAWLTVHARHFGFYPYLPEAWHWEYNPPGLVAQLATLRAALRRGESPGELLRAPDPVPVAHPAPARPPRPG